MKILYIDSTVRKNSRTAALAEYVLTKLGGETERVRLSETAFPAVSEKFIEERSRKAESGDFSDEIFAAGRQFADADTIVIAAPYWDLSFPATLKQYLEQINVVGLTFKYTEDGRPVGLCKANKLIYITTAGGPVISDEYGFGYVKALARNFYGINDCVCFKAENLDIFGADVGPILERCKDEIDAYFGK